MSPRSETDVLAGMMGADSRRIDGLVDSIGEVKGDVRALRSDVGHVADGIGELRGAMAVLGRHAVLMETNAADMKKLREDQADLDSRVQEIEVQMPGLMETRSAVMRGLWAVVGLVGVAVVGLVIKIQIIT